MHLNIHYIFCIHIDEEYFNFIFLQIEIMCKIRLVFIFLKLSLIKINCRKILVYFYY